MSHDLSRSKNNLESRDVLPALMTPEDMIQLLGVSARTLWRLRSNGAIPRPVKYGGNVRWRGKDIQTWLDEGCPGRD